MGLIFKKSIFLCLCLSSCYESDLHFYGLNNKNDLVEDEIDRYIHQFEQDFNLKVDFPVFFSDIMIEKEKPGTLAYCINSEEAQYVVLSEYFKNYPKFLKTIIYHELGHCALNLNHSYDTFFMDELTYQLDFIKEIDGVVFEKTMHVTPSVGTSIMFPYIVMQDPMIDLLPEYITELKTGIFKNNNFNKAYSYQDDDHAKSFSSYFYYRIVENDIVIYEGLDNATAWQKAFNLKDKLNLLKID